MHFWVPKKKVKVLRLEEHVNAWILGSAASVAVWESICVVRYGVQTEATADASKHVYVGNLGEVVKKMLQIGFWYSFFLVFVLTKTSWLQMGCLLHQD